MIDFTYILRTSGFFLNSLGLWTKVKEGKLFDDDKLVYSVTDGIEPNSNSLEIKYYYDSIENLEESMTYINVDWSNASTLVKEKLFKAIIENI